MVSIPAMMILALQNDLKPSIGRVIRLMARWSCSTMLLRYFTDGMVYVVGWMIALRESAQLAEQVIAYTLAKQISDDAGEFGKAVEGSQLARGCILEWFHIAMTFKASENSVFGSPTIEHAKWLVWHRKGGKSVARIKALDASLMARKGYEHSALWWNLRRLYCYIDNNAGTLVNYGARYHKGLPISSSIAESAVNQVVSQRMAKKQQMRWTDEGTHCLAQVRVAALNGEFSVKGLAELAKIPCANSSRSRQAA